MAKKKRKRRHTTYKEWITPEGLLKIEGWAKDGLINEQIAHNIGIAEGTLYEWKNKYSDIDEALKQGKEVIDRKVENALLKKALGFEYEEVKRIQTKDADGKDILRQEKTTKLIPGDSTAQIFWLKNRKPAEWRDRRDIEHSGGVGVTIDEQEKVTELIQSDETAKAALRQFIERADKINEESAGE